MATIRSQITQLFQQAIVKAFGAEFSEVSPQISFSVKAQHGDFQANFAMKLAGKLQKAPAEIATKVIQTLPKNALLAKAEVSGPGFINLFLADTFLVTALQSARDSDTLGVEPASQKTIVVDYGGANIAKEMHIGHLRSPTIGDALVRVLQFVGHKVIKQNHLGDWGTQFGMLIQHMLDIGWSAEQAESDKHAVNNLYKHAKQRYDTDTDFSARARERVVLLQSGEAESLQLWQTLVAASREDFHQIYQYLGISLAAEDDRGESFYNNRLLPLVNEFLRTAIAVEDQGAVVVPLEDFFDKDNQPLPLMVRKSDGGFLYATTDLAALQFRLQDLQAQRLIYVTDARQKQHFAMVFATAKKAGWLQAGESLEHAAFGSILGKDKKPFKTRSGESIKLRDVLQEAESRAKKQVEEKNPSLSAEQQSKIAVAIAVAAVKYADLATDLRKDYVFDWDKMLAFEGNTAPYLLNAYVRIQAIFRKLSTETLRKSEIILSEPQERKLALQLLLFDETVNTVAAELAPHKLCHYLYELASSFHQFYEHCPVLKAATTIQAARLQLCEHSARVLATGLHLLGIPVLQQM